MNSINYGFHNGHGFSWTSELNFNSSAWLPQDNLESFVRCLWMFYNSGAFNSFIGFNRLKGFKRSTKQPPGTVPVETYNFDFVGFILIFNTAYNMQHIFNLSIRQLEMNVNNPNDIPQGQPPCTQPANQVHCRTLNFLTPVKGQKSIEGYQHLDIKSFVKFSLANL